MRRARMFRKDGSLTAAYRREVISNAKRDQRLAWVSSFTAFCCMASNDAEKAIHWQNLAASYHRASAYHVGLLIGVVVR